MYLRNLPFSIKGRYKQPNQKAKDKLDIFLLNYFQLMCILVLWWWFCYNKDSRTVLELTSCSWGKFDNSLPKQVVWLRLKLLLLGPKMLECWFKWWLFLLNIALYNCNSYIVSALPKFIKQQQQQQKDWKEKV